MTTTEMLASVASNQFNWVKAKRIMIERNEYNETGRQQLADAAETADRARAAADGYLNDY